MSVEGKVVAITGESGGIGEATALLLAESRARLVLGARRNDRLATLADRIARAGGAAVYRVTDVRRHGDLTSLAELARARYGRLDVLVNNAGIGPISPLDSLRVDEWEDMVDVNIKGVLYGVAAALPIFAPRSSGTSSPSRPLQGSRPSPISRFIPPRSSRFAHFARGCARRPAISCASRSSRQGSFGPTSSGPFLIAPSGSNWPRLATRWQYRRRRSRGPSPSPSTSHRTWTSTRSSYGR
jgi:NAD(P)-dependent dehydrogenase (short-subunit alcohol dehydrogenase family)